MVERKDGKGEAHPLFGRQRTVGRRAEVGGRDLVGLPRAESGGTTYFVTFASRPGIKLDRQERGWVLESIRWGHGRLWRVIGAVVMPDHAHMMITPIGAGEGARAPTDPLTGAELPERRWLALGAIVGGIKSVTARRINRRRDRRGSVWLDGYYDRSVRDDADRRVKLAYMENNPVKRGLVDRGRDWDGWWRE